MIEVTATNYSDGQLLKLRPGQALTGLRLRAINIKCQPQNLLDEEFTMWLNRLACRRVVSHDPIEIEVR